MLPVFSNRNRITLGSFLTYFVMSAVISPLGLVSAPLAEAFDVPVTTATASFTYLTSGVFAGTLLAVFVFDYYRLQSVVLGGAVLILLALISIYSVPNFTVFSVSLAVIGICCGVELSAAAVVISKLFEERLRASMLLLTDSFYSIAGVASTSVAGILLARGLQWPSAYAVAFAATAVVLIIAATARYPATRSASATSSPAADVAGWPVSVHVIGFAMLIYLVGFVSLYSWVPNYAQEFLGADVEYSGVIVSRLFLGMFIGQLIMFFLVFRVPLPLLMIVCLVMAATLTIALWSVDAARYQATAMLCLGLATGGVFKIVLTYGTLQVNDPSPRMVSYLIFYAGLGTSIAPLVSAAVVAGFGMMAALQFVTVCYVATVLLVGLAIGLRKKAPAAGSDNSHSVNGQ